MKPSQGLPRNIPGGEGYEDRFNWMKYKCPTCELGVIIPLSRTGCKCSTGCLFFGNTKELIRCGVITHYMNGERIENSIN